MLIFFVGYNAYEARATQHIAEALSLNSNAWHAICAGDLRRKINACLRWTRQTRDGKNGRMQRRRLIADNLPESLLSNESLFGACRRLRSVHKTRRTSVAQSVIQV